MHIFCNKDFFFIFIIKNVNSDYSGKEKVFPHIDFYFYDLKELKRHEINIASNRIGLHEILLILETFILNATY